LNSASGVPVYRHQHRDRQFRAPVRDENAIARIKEHICRHVGQTAIVYHEIVSDLVHIDIHVVEPTPSRDFYTLITTGMSDEPMTTPEGAKGYEYSELLICLPPSWPMFKEDWQEEQNYWPVRWLRSLARFPHEYDTWLWVGHTLPNGDPPQPYASNTRFCCALLATPVLFGDALAELKVDSQKTVYFHGFIPLYEEEIDVKLNLGTGELFDRLSRNGVTELLDIKRESVRDRLN